MSKIFKLFIFIFTALSLSALCACGRYSEPSPVSGSGFPHSYPSSSGD